MVRKLFRVLNETGREAGRKLRFFFMKYYINENGACESQVVVFATAEKIRVREDGQVVQIKRVDEGHISVAGVLYDVPLHECVPLSNQLYAGFPVLAASLAAFIGLMYIKKLSEVAISEIN